MGFHSFEALTSKTSRNQIGIVGTLRNLHSLPDNFRQAILTTVGRIISFAVAQRDASLLGPLMFRSSDIEENTRKNFFASPPERKDNVDSVDALYDQLVYQEPFEFFCCSLSKAGAFKIKAVKPELVDDRNINKDLLEHIRSNSHRASTRT
jgi:hypothetical protein